MDGERDLKVAIRDVAQAMERGLEVHPSHDELLGYAAGALDAVEQDRVEDHLALCRKCTRTVLDLAALPDEEQEEPERKKERLPEGVLAAEWARFRRAAAPARPSPFRRLIAATSPTLPYALAASLLLMLGLGWRTIRLGEKVRQLSAPESNIYVTDLVPVGSGRPRERGEQDVVSPPAWTSRVLLILDFTGPAYPEYGVELAKANGEPIWRRRGLRPGPDGTFTLEVPRLWLPAATYRIRLSGLRGGAEEEVARYEFRVIPAERSGSLEER